MFCFTHFDPVSLKSANSLCFNVISLLMCRVIFGWKNCHCFHTCWKQFLAMKFVDKTWRSVSILVVGFHCCTMGAFSVSVCCMAWWFLQNYSSVAACLVTSTFWMSFLDLSLQDVNHAPREWVEWCKSNQGKAEVSCRWQYNNRCWWCVCSLARLLH